MTTGWATKLFSCYFSGLCAVFCLFCIPLSASTVRQGTSAAACTARAESAPRTAERSWKGPHRWRVVGEKEPLWYPELMRRMRSEDQTVQHQLHFKQSKELESSKIVEIRELENTANVVSVSDLKAGFKYRVRLENGMEAVLKTSKEGVKADAGVQSEVAAFRLSYFLFAELVPPTAFRTVGNFACSIQLFLKDVSEQNVLQRNGIKTSGYLPDPSLPRDILKKRLFEIMDEGDLNLFYYVFGQWDGHGRNRLYTKVGRVKIIDNEELSRRTLMTLNGPRLRERGPGVHMPLNRLLLPDEIAKATQAVPATLAEALAVTSQAMDARQAQKLAEQIVSESQRGLYTRSGYFHFALIDDGNGKKHLFTEVKTSSNPMTELPLSINYLNGPFMSRLIYLQPEHLLMALPPKDFPVFDWNWRHTIYERVQMLQSQMLDNRANVTMPYGFIANVYPDLKYDVRYYGWLVYDFQDGVIIDHYELKGETPLDIIEQLRNEFVDHP